jgi:hypothetical protein
MKNKNSKIELLRWVIDFINCDIDKLTKADLAKLFIELLEKLNFEKKLPQIDGVGKDLMKEFTVKVLGGEKSLTEIREVLGAKKISLNDDSPLWPPLRGFAKKNQKIIRDVFEKIYEAKSFSEITKRDQDRKYLTLFKFNANFIVYAGHNVLWVGTDRIFRALEYEIAELIYSCAPDLGFELRSLNNLKKCQVPDCQKYFWQVHKKEKNYCSNKCAWRAYSKFKRDEEKKDRAKRKKND